ncbi:DNA repair protein rad51c [Apophysomyces sp. BC1034]|nr:DNA repair protein rad51c [Apophysomyces sp. BC1034]
MPRRLADEIASQNLLEKLEDAGYETVEELKEANLLDLTRGLCPILILALALRLYPLLRSTKADEGRRVEGFPQSQNGAELAQIQRERKGIPSSCKRLDMMFGQYGGIPPCRITEFCGESGIGKTQLCLQLALNVQLEKHGGGLEGECIYIDTEGSLLTQRIAEMAERSENGDTLERILEKIHVFRVLDHAELIAIIRQLPMILKEKPNVKLVILDSIAFHMRLNVRDARVRTNLLQLISQTLMKIADQHELAKKGIEDSEDEDILPGSESQDQNHEKDAHDEEQMAWIEAQSADGPWDQHDLIYTLPPVIPAEDFSEKPSLDKHVNGGGDHMKQNTELMNESETAYNPRADQPPLAVADDEGTRQGLKLSVAHSFELEHTDDQPPSGGDRDNFWGKGSTYEKKGATIIPDSQPTSPSDFAVEEGEWSISLATTGKRRRDGQGFEVCGSDEDELWLQFADIESP